MGKDLSSLKTKFVKTSAQMLTWLAQAGAKSLCFGPWYEPKVPMQLKQDKQ